MRYALLLLLVFALPSPAAAQGGRPHVGAVRDAVGLWGGASFSTPGLWGAVQGRALFIVGVQYRHPLSRSPSASLAYTFDLIPAAAVTKTPTRVSTACCSYVPLSGRRGAREIEQVEPATAYGFGVAPLGLQLVLFQQRPVQFALGIAGGLLLFDRDVPMLDTRRMNFTAELGAGVRIPIRDHWEATLGYKFHHISNAGTGTFNPGLDVNMFYLSWMYR